jgi:hypothetical protein
MSVKSEAKQRKEDAQEIVDEIYGIAYSKATPIMRETLEKLHKKHNELMWPPRKKKGEE